MNQQAIHHKPKEGGLSGFSPERLGDKTPSTVATRLRDAIWRLSETDRRRVLARLKTPPYRLRRDIHGAVCQMFNFNAENRLKDKVEETLYDNVCYCIVGELLDEDRRIAENTNT